MLLSVHCTYNVKHSKVDHNQTALLEFWCQHSPFFIRKDHYLSHCQLHRACSCEEEGGA